MEPHVNPSEKGASGGADWAWLPLVSGGADDHSAGRTMAHLNCNSTNHFLSLSEHLLAGPGAPGGWAAGTG